MVAVQFSPFFTWLSSMAYRLNILKFLFHLFILCKNQCQYNRMRQIVNFSLMKCNMSQLENQKLCQYVQRSIHLCVCVCVDV